MIHFCEVPRTVKPTEPETEWGLPQGWMKRSYYSMWRVSSWDDDKGLETDGGWQFQNAANVLNTTELYT